MTGKLEQRAISPRIELPPPADDSVVSLFDAAAKRCTTREIAATPLTQAQLSNLLWTACGVNRKEGPYGAPGRTAASASNSQEIEVYVLLQEGAYLYNALAHRLDVMAGGDIRFEAMNSRQGVACKAPVQLIYVANLSRLTHTLGFEEPGLHDPEIQKSYYLVDTGLIAGNVYLFAAANGLASWFHNCAREQLAESLELRPDQKVLFAQSVGWPATA